MAVHLNEDSELAFPTPELVHHSRRPGWGTGMLVGEDGRRRRYQFEDGKLRAFKEGFFHLLVPVEPETSDARDLMSELEAKHDAALARKEISRRRHEGDLSAIRMVDQLQVFADIYPQGFDDPLFIERSREPEEGKRVCKRHVDAAIELGAIHLDPHRLHAAYSAGQHGAVVSHFLSVVQRTDLVAVGRDIKPLRALTPDWHAELSPALVNLTLAASRGPDEEDPDNPFEAAFDAWIGVLRAALDDAPSWQLATAPAAFVAPQRHVLVLPTVYRLQARWVAPTLRWTDAPFGRTYTRLQAMALQVRERLVEEGHAPRDQFDTGRFIWETLRQRGRQRLKAMVSGD